MKIKKRDGSMQAFMPNKILNRIKSQAKGLKVDCDKLFQEVMPLINDGISTLEIDEIIALAAADKIILHPDYSILGGRLLISRQSKILNIPTKEVDLTYDFFSAKTFLDKYSKRIKVGNESKPVELPHLMYERVAEYLTTNEEDRLELLDELNNKRVNFATPTYTNSGIESRNGLISCVLMTLKEDSIEGIEETLTSLAYNSKEGSGIGLLIDSLRSKESLVSSFNGNAGGVVRFADMVQSKMRFYKQGSRSGSCALYLSLWHRDILDFLELTLPVGSEKNRARDLFLAVVVNDLFMKKLQNNEPWHLFCPNDIKLAGLRPLYELLGDDFEEEYNKAVEMGIGYEIEPKKIWDAIIRSQSESGRPYVMFKENANKRNMQDNIGIIKQSNLCAEIFQSSSPAYSAQCVLASINLANHSDLKSIEKSTKVLVKALNVVIDKNKWSDEWSERAGLDQRALAIGVAGLADMFAKLKISFESEEAKKWNNDIFETMYKAAVTQSNKMAEERNMTYPAWKGSRYERGETYIEGWSPKEKGEPIPVLNSLFLGLMPTASSAILLGSFESFEPVTSNLFSRKVGKGEFLVINKYLVEELDELGFWGEYLLDRIIQNNGSIQNIVEIPEDIRYRYKEVWEIPQKTLMDLSIIRNKYVDQSQSLNLYYSSVKYEKMSGALMYGWKNGLKTGVYYTRTKSKSDNNTKLSSLGSETSASSLPQKPVNSQYECEGCSA